ncbi:RidA family protein [Bradyrhizobium sp. 27S5]|uniref:RidA family protein n=1 Tax=Bradyrhizobium sp. 27S5 TaxID=3139728 RepID=UPI0030CEA1D7
MIEILQPDGWAKPIGYANGMAARGKQIFIAGQIGWNGQCVFETDDLVAQIAQTLRNIVAVAAAGGAGPEHIVSMTWYLLDRKEYSARLKEIGAVYRDVIGRSFPAMTAVQVAGLIEDRAKVEIQAIAVLPDRGDRPQSNPSS